MMRELRKRELIPENMKQYLENIGASGGTDISTSSIDDANAALEAAMKEKQKRQVGG